MEIFDFQKGKIVIQLDQRQFSRGETIAGTLELQLKKATQAKGLSIALVGERVEYDPRTRERTRYQVFDFSLPLDGEKEYAAGPLTYPFQISIPQDIAPARPEGALGTFLQAAQMLGSVAAQHSGGSGVLQWHLLGRLAIAGFDLTKKISINVT